MYLREGLKEFLEETSKKFELVLFNSSSKLFTDEIALKMIGLLFDGDRDISQFFTYILCSDHISLNESKHEVKNLHLFCNPQSGRNIKDCIIIDNNIFAA